MSSPTANVLMIGDVVGAPGLRALFALLPSIIKKTEADLVIANGENALKGFGISQEEMTAMRSYGVDIVTSGNHVWERKEAIALLDTEMRLLRPANYPKGLPGRGAIAVEGRRFRWFVINLQGRRDMYDIDCPFAKADQLVSQAARENPGAFIVVDFHAEMNEEKEALAWYLDGRASVVAGTHTHVPTADERILPQGTGYLTDLGMTGPIDSVIGMNGDTCVRRFLTQIPFKMETADGPSALMGALFRIDPEHRRCVEIQRIYEAI
ncbi:MAG: TIGR00282 family metallophosphoesterase [Rectinema sp.]|nr:TIGR00282 family metallophosphoesterase [Rectinema sp.]